MAEIPRLGLYPSSTVPTKTRLPSSKPGPNNATMPAQVDSNGGRVKRLAAIILGLWCGSAAGHDAPFAPIPNVPDYIAAFNIKPNSARIDSRIVTHHGGWVRVDGEIDNTYRSTSYIRIADPLTITAGYDLSDPTRYTSLWIRRGIDAHRSYGWTYEPVKTGDGDVILGEPCEIWVVARHATTGYQNAKEELRRLSCVTQDGIELHDKFVATRYDGTQTEAVSLVRRPVQAHDVLPPADLFQLKTWLTEPAPTESDRPGDATVTMENPHPGTHPDSIKARIVRRHHPWTHAEDIYVGGQRKGKITNKKERLTIQFEVGADGRVTQLSLQKWRPVPSGIRTMEPVALKEQATILGETCTVYDMSPGVMDAGLKECRTEDGLVLSQRRTTFGSSRYITATRIDRSPVPLSQVSPAAILARGNWGLAD